MHNWVTCSRLDCTVSDQTIHPNHAPTTAATPLNRVTQTRVLVIDDDDAMIDMLKLVLQPDAFELRFANSGPAGIEAARRLLPDIIVLDLLVSNMSGWRVCQAIREFTQAPILVISVISNPGLVARALDEGADDYLLKPMTSSVLIAHVKRLAWRARIEKEAKNAKINYYGI